MGVMKWMFLVIFTWLFFTQSGSAAEHRVALVIGNADYPDGPLLNPRNDASDIRLRLQELDFSADDIVYRENLRRSDIGSTLDEFRGKLKPGSVALVFFAGHGVQMNGENYLLTVDGKISRDEDVPKESLKFTAVLDLLAQANVGGLNLIFLDACRNNPFSRSLKVATRGLGRVQNHGHSLPGNTLIVYATKANSAAADGRGRNGTFTAALLAHMAEPELPIEDMLRKVLADVKDATHGVQEPWQEGSMVDKFYFAGAPSNADVVKIAIPIAKTSGVTQGGAVLGKVQIRDCAQCPELVLVPVGSFEMGNPTGEAQVRPGHKVRLQSFFIGKMEVTQKQWQQIMGNNPSSFKDCGDMCPVEEVSWQDVQEYLQKLNARSGLQFRLPSEAEWEYAMRANSTTPYPWGDFISHEYANYGKDACCGGFADGRDKWVHTAPVASFPANSFGLFDMAGNVKEWVADCWHGNYEDAPVDGSAWTSKCIGSDRVVRGGSWIDRPSVLLSSYRQKHAIGERWNTIGFRVARSLP